MTRLSGAQWRYCAKVGLAASLGHLLTLGIDSQYAIYSTFTAALIVGTSVGEDLATSGNRVKGTLVGMLAGISVAALVGPSFLSIGAAAAFTALIAIAFGWGVPVARIGVTICIITLAVHSGNAVHYDLMRAINTLIGVVAGLAVTFFVWPVHGRTEIERTMREVVLGARALLDAIARGEQNIRTLEARLHDGVSALVKAARDARLEQKAGHPATVDDAQMVECARLGVDVLSAALGPRSTGAVEALARRIDQLESEIRKPAI